MPVCCSECKDDADTQVRESRKRKHGGQNAGCKSTLGGCQTGEVLRGELSEVEPANQGRARAERGRMLCVRKQVAGLYLVLLETSRLMAAWVMVYKVMRYRIAAAQNCFILLWSCNHLNLQY